MQVFLKSCFVTTQGLEEEENKNKNVMGGCWSGLKMGSKRKTFGGQGTGNRVKPYFHLAWIPVKF